MAYSKSRTNPKTESKKSKFNPKSKFKNNKKGKGGGGGGGELRGLRKKKNKLALVFDPTARNEFLGGFHKRKLEKKAHYKTNLEKKVTEEKARIRAQAKKSVGQLSSSHRILPEVEALLASSDVANPNFLCSVEAFEVGSKTVTITSLDSIHTPVPEVPGEVDGNNSSDAEDDPLDKKDIKKEKKGSDNGEAGAGGGSDDEEDNSIFQGNMKSMLKKSTNRLLQNSKIYKAAMRLKRKGKKCKKNPHYVAKPSATGEKSKKSDSKDSKGKNNHNFRRKGQQHKTKGKKGKH